MAKIRKEKYRLRKSILYLILTIFFIVFAISVFFIVKWLDEAHDSRKINKEIDDIVDDRPITTIDGVDIQDNNVTFDKLKNINKDTIAYININDTNIHYPIVKTNNNDYYLNHSFNKSKNSAGWIFMDYRNKFDGSDKNIILYGHNRLDGIMFGSLKKVLDKDFYSNRNNLIIDIHTDNVRYKYQIFSAYRIKAEDYYITVDFSNIDYNEFINTLKSRSLVNYGVDINGVESILTLSTCTINDGERLVVHAKRLT